MTSDDFLAKMTPLYYMLGYDVEKFQDSKEDFYTFFRPRFLFVTKAVCALGSQFPLHKRFKQYALNKFDRDETVKTCFEKLVLFQSTELEKNRPKFNAWMKKHPHLMIGNIQLFLYIGIIFSYVDYLKRKLDNNDNGGLASIDEPRSEHGHDRDGQPLDTPDEDGESEDPEDDDVEEGGGEGDDDDEPVQIELGTSPTTGTPEGPACSGCK